jgi:hypothetical protein
MIDVLTRGRSRSIFRCKTLSRFACIDNRETATILTIFHLICSSKSVASPRELPSAVSVTPVRAATIASQHSVCISTAFQAAIAFSINRHSAGEDRQNFALTSAEACLWNPTNCWQYLKPAQSMTVTTWTKPASHPCKPLFGH